MTIFYIICIHYKFIRIIKSSIPRVKNAFKVYPYCHEISGILTCLVKAEINLDVDKIAS